MQGKPNLPTGIPYSNKQQQQNQNLEALFQHLPIWPPYWATTTTTSLGDPMYLGKYFFSFYYS
jgi:hypothetical protein